MEEVDYEFFKKRIRDYMLKAAREAKVNTSWISPNIPYEEALVKFIDAILSHPQRNPFLEDFYGLQKKVAYFGMFNSLSQTLLKITSPGTPDFYQGTEIWDFSLVDPDNRRLVNFAIRKKMLGALKEKMAAYGSDLPGFARELLLEWSDGSIKLYLTFKSLNYRKENRELFMDGDYIPLMGDGALKDHLCAFARQEKNKAVLVIVPRFLTRLTQMDEMPLGEKTWGDSWLVIPDEMSANRFRNILTHEMLGSVEQHGGTGIALDQVFANFPVALLEAI
jgi:(1->4)-alpha-D-glucan 1-alpha-D-glucosylmutase